MKRLIVCWLCATAALCAQNVEKFVQTNALGNDLASLAAMRKLREDFRVTRVDTLEVKALENQVSVVRRTVWPTLLMMREVRETGDAADFNHERMALARSTFSDDLLYTPEGLFRFYAAPAQSPARRSYNRACNPTQLAYPKDWSRNLYVATVMPLQVLERTFALTAEQNRRTNHPDIAARYTQHIDALRAALAGGQPEISLAFPDSTLFLKRTDKGLLQELSITEKGSRISVYIANTFETAPVKPPEFSLRDSLTEEGTSSGEAAFGFGIGMEDGTYRLIPNTRWGVYLYGDNAFVEFTTSPIVRINGKPAPELSQADVDNLLKTQKILRIEFAIPPTSRIVELKKLSTREQAILHCAAEVKFPPEKFFE